jgi:uncharacterized phiE125 gp8 family phage protein
VALDTNALVDLATAKAFLLTTGSQQDAAVEQCINAATLTVEEYCNRWFKERTVTADRVEGPPATHLWLRSVPLKASATVTVTVDDVAQTVWRTEADGLQSAFDVIARPDHLYRRDGWMPGSTDPYNVLVTYTGGYATTAMPSPVKQACLYVIQKLFRDSQRQLAEVAQVNTPMGGISLIDNAGLPRMCRALLDPFRLRVFA